MPLKPIVRLGGLRLGASASFPLAVGQASPQPEGPGDQP
jgi:hypothetical protein